MTGRFGERQMKGRRRRRIMKKRTVLLALACCLAAAFLPGCGGGSGKRPPGGAAGAETAAAGDSDADIGSRAFLAAEGLDAAAGTDDGKVYSDGKVNPGCWNLAEKITVGEADEELFTFSAAGVGKTYQAGAACEPYITFTRTKKQQEEKRVPCGALYFALPSSGDPGLFDKLTVLEYCLKNVSTSYAQVQLNCFTPENDGRTGSAENAAGDSDTYFAARGYFPKKVAEGDEIWLVLDLSDTGADAPVMRTVWKFRWTFGETESAVEETGEDHEGDPEFYKEEFPGHWERTDIRYTGTAGEAGAGGDAGAKMGRTGTDGRDMLCRLEEGDKKILVRIPELRLRNLYYAGDSFVEEICIYCDTISEDVPDSLRCALWLGDVSFDTAGAVTGTSPEYRFTKGYPGENVESFSPIPHGKTMSWRNDLQRGYLMVDGVFPEGEKEGEKLYLVFEAEDTGAGGTRLMNIYEYTWHQGPETVWFYNPPMPD